MPRLTQVILKSCMASSIFAWHVDADVDEAELAEIMKHLYWNMLLRDQ
jgi:hypothetical protein